MDEATSEPRVVRTINPPTTWKDVVFAIVFFGTMASLILLFITKMA